MDAVRRGTWLVNSYKHFLNIRQDAPELAHYEATETAGKAGALLARLVADQSEVVPSHKVRLFARQSAIRKTEIPALFTYLKSQGKVDFNQSDDAYPDVEVYCFSTKDALATASSIYDTNEPSAYERATLVTLEETFQLPRSEDELLETLTASGHSEKEARMSMELQEALDLVKVSRSDRYEVTLFYNEHAFSGDPRRIARALDGLTDSERREVTEVIDLIEGRPGFPMSDLARFTPKVLNALEGVGLIDAVTVDSEHAQEAFVTSPQLKGISIDALPLSMDVFHKAKVLLASLRFGELRSTRGRGEIATYDKMLNIVNKLLRGEWVGPCTAIGQDYRMLELDGVVATRPSKEGWRAYYDMYEMKLRQREVGVLVGQMLEYGHLLPEANPDLSKVLAQEPVVAYEIPETRRTKLLAKQTQPVRDIRERLFQAMRSGMRDEFQ